MKKIFEKYDLLKVLVIFIVLVTILSWVCSTTYYSNGIIMNQGVHGAGFFDVVTGFKVGVANFFETFGFIMATYAMYKIVSSTMAYDQIVSSVAKKLSPNVLLVGSTAITAILASVFNQPITVLIFIPFIMSVFVKAKIDKVAGIAATFGGAMIGIMASTFSETVAVMYKSAFEVDATANFIYSLLLLVLLVVVMSYFVIKRNKENSEKLESIFVSNTEKKDSKKVKKVKKVSVLPLIIMSILFAVISILASIPWKDVFEVSAFTDLHKSITEATLFGDTVIYNVLGASLGELGAWTLDNFVGLMVIFTLIVKIIYRIPFDKILDGLVDGIKGSVKTILLVSLSYTVFVITVSYPVLPGLLDKILSFDLNFATILLVAFIASLFVTDPYYVVALVSGGMLAFESTNVAAMALQFGAGIANIIAPTSVMLILGLSLFNVDYKEWLKFIWKFLLATIVLACIVLAVMLYV